MCIEKNWCQISSVKRTEITILINKDERSTNLPPSGKPQNLSLPWKNDIEIFFLRTSPLSHNPP